jgi:vacuolar-type H+-ATPase subunit F/Vma7
VRRIAVLGEGILVEPYALAGAFVVVAEEPAAVRTAWDSLPDDVAVVILTPAAAAALPDDVTSQCDDVLTVTMS